MARNSRSKVLSRTAMRMREYRRKATPEQRAERDLKSKLNAYARRYKKVALEGRISQYKPYKQRNSKRQLVKPKGLIISSTSPTDDVPPSASEPIRLPCPICTKLFTPRRLSNHIITHLPKKDRLYKCELCPTSYNHLGHYNAHRKRHTEIRKPPLDFAQYFCEVCSAVVQKDTSFISHMNNHRRNEMIQFEDKEELYFYQCDFEGCHLNFRQKIHFEKHMTSHPSSSISLVCETCTRVFFSKSKHKAHVEEAHTANSYDCPYCYEILKLEESKTHLKKHMLILGDRNGPPATCLCDACGQVFSTAEILQRHINKIHKGVEDDLRSRKSIYYGRVKNVCRICNHLATNKDTLNNHLLNAHTYEHGTICYICERRFATLGALKMHYHSHDSIQNLSPTNLFNCMYCTKVFSSYNMRNKHQFLTHGEKYLADKPFHCVVCFRNFSTEEEMEVHYDIHRKWKCSICSHHSISQLSHAVHMKAHENPSSKVCRNYRNRIQMSEQMLLEVGDPVEHVCEGINKKESLRRIELNKNNFVKLGTKDVQHARQFKAKYRDEDKAETTDAPSPPAIDDSIVGINVTSANPKTTTSLSLLNQDEQISPALGLSDLNHPPQPQNLDMSIVAKDAPCDDRDLIRFPDKPFKCDKCSKEYLHPMGLFRHIRWLHNSDIADISEEVDELSDAYISFELNELSTYKNPAYGLPFKCDFCPRQYADETHLMRHENSVHGYEFALDNNEHEKQFVDDSIETPDATPSTSKPSLNEEPLEGSIDYRQFINTPQKPYKCDQCSSQWYHVASLLKHLKQHEAIPCGSSSTVKINLTAEIPSEFQRSQLHKYRNPNYVPEIEFLRYKCDKCVESFGIIEALVSHRHTMHGLTMAEAEISLPFKCDSCPSQFEIEFYLRRHKKCFHGPKTSGFVNNINPKQSVSFRTKRAEKMSTAAVDKGKVGTPNDFRRFLIVPPKTYKCDKCSRQWYHSAYLLKHLKWHEAMASGSSPNTKITLTPQELSEFQGKELPKYRNPDYAPEIQFLRYKCDKCVETFGIIDALVSHRHTIHGLTLAEAEISLPFKCDSCSAQFEIDLYHRRHKKWCQGPKTSSVVTNKNSKQSVSNKTQTGDKMSTVVPDSVKARTTNNLPITSQKLYKCDQCSSQWQISAYLMKHLEWHKVGTLSKKIKPSPEERLDFELNELHKYLNPDYNSQAKDLNLKCDACDETFPRAEALLSHRHTAHGTVLENSKRSSLSKCKFCSREFVLDSAFLDHMASVHQYKLGKPDEKSKETKEIRSKETKSKEKSNDNEQMAGYYQYKCPVCLHNLIGKNVSDLQGRITLHLKVHVDNTTANVQFKNHKDKVGLLKLKSEETNIRVKNVCGGNEVVLHHNPEHDGSERVDDEDWWNEDPVHDPLAGTLADTPIRPEVTELVSWKQPAIMMVDLLLHSTGKVAATQSSYRNSDGGFEEIKDEPFDENYWADCMPMKSLLVPTKESEEHLNSDSESNSVRNENSANLLLIKRRINRSHFHIHPELRKRVILMPFAFVRLEKLSTEQQQKVKAGKTKVGEINLTPRTMVNEVITPGHFKILAEKKRKFLAAKYGQQNRMKEQDSHSLSEELEVNNSVIEIDASSNEENEKPERTNSDIKSTADKDVQCVNDEASLPFRRLTRSQTMRTRRSTEPGVKRKRNKFQTLNSYDAENDRHKGKRKKNLSEEEKNLSFGEEHILSPKKTAQDKVRQTSISKVEAKKRSISTDNFKEFDVSTLLPGEIVVVNTNKIQEDKLKKICNVKSHKIVVVKKIGQNETRPVKGKHEGETKSPSSIQVKLTSPRKRKTIEGNSKPEKQVELENDEKPGSSFEDSENDSDWFGDIQQDCSDLSEAEASAPKPPKRMKSERRKKKDLRKRNDFQTLDSCEKKNERKKGKRKKYLSEGEKNLHSEEDASGQDYTLSPKKTSQVTTRQSSISTRKGKKGSTVYGKSEPNAKKTSISTNNANQTASAKEFDVLKVQPGEVVVILTKKMKIQKAKKMFNVKTKGIVVVEAKKIEGNETRRGEGKNEEHLKNTLFCEYCNRKFPRGSNVKAHIEKAHKNNPTPYECENCGQKFAIRSTYRRHRENVHWRRGTQEWIPKPERRIIEAIDVSSNYQCDLCHLVLNGRKRYDRHLRTHSNFAQDVIRSGKIIWTYLCDAKDCKHMFRRHDHFIRHLESHAPFGVLVCQVCEKVFAESENLDKHTQNVHENSGKTVFDCAYCFNFFEDEASFKRHEERHKVDLSCPLPLGIHICEHCGKDFTTISSMNSHIQQFHGPDCHLDPRAKPKNFFGKPKLCQICGESFNHVTRKRYKAHLLRHTYDQDLVCYICDKTFPEYEPFKNHMGCHQNRIPHFLETEKKKKSFTCQYCDLVLETRELIILHRHYYSEHLDEYLKNGGLVCNLCFAVFPSNEALLAHTKTAHDKHKCSLCGKQFMRQVYLRTHLLSHSGEKPHKCSLCDKSFSTIFVLRDHEKRHKKEFKVFCPLCPNNTVGFYRQVHLDQHLQKRHHDNVEVKKFKRKRKPRRDRKLKGAIRPQESLHSPSSQVEDECEEEQPSELQRENANDVLNTQPLELQRENPNDVLDTQPPELQRENPNGVLVTRPLEFQRENPNNVLGTQQQLHPLFQLPPFLVQPQDLQSFISGYPFGD